MPPTVLLTAETDETLDAPEFRYLRSWVELQVRRALGEVVAGSFADRGGFDRVLLLANPRLLVSARSLVGLARALEAGAEVAAPRPLAELPAAAAGTIRTLRGFELVEEKLSAGERVESGAPEHLPPVALLTGDAWRRLDGPGSRLPRGLRFARAGLYHEFIDYYGEVRSDALPHIPGGTRRILEVGCGRGATGEMLRRTLGARVTGVELNPVVARAAAQRLDRVVAGDIEDPSLAPELARDAPYDLVLATELFEHLAYPEAFLERSRELLRPGGTLLLSTPNVGHYSVVEDLLAGRWDYLPIGLLCYTHLRFFTRRTLEDWLGRLGFERFELIAQHTEESPNLEALARAVEVDRESLRTQGFWVRIEVP